ncbi:MAG: ABC transporter substrate-binding protein [Opitutaceae bacterium]
MIKLGELCGTEAVAREQVRSLSARMEGVRRHAEGSRPIRTLVVVGGGSEGALLRSVYVSGRDGFYDELVRIAGGENVVTTRTMSVPTLSAEGLTALDPEVIIQVRDEVESRGTSPEESRIPTPALVTGLTAKRAGGGFPEAAPRRARWRGRRVCAA